MDKSASMRETLKTYFGYDNFRPLQEEIIRHILNKQDALVLMPTGGGKSICYQLPALLCEGTAVVVSPLISLMKDQVEALLANGIAAGALNSSNDETENANLRRACIEGRLKLLYISPEKLLAEKDYLLRDMNISLFAIDEAHCISQWGYDFRPSYLNIAEIRDLLPGVPVLALTATATPEVVNDIQERLRFKEKNVFQKSFARKNLAYIVRKTEDKLNTLVYILGKVPGTAIVYVRNRKRTKEIAVMLQQAGISADFFHAGLNRDEKELRQARWKNNECRVIVSTNAFGMGIDKPDVRLVVHMDMPGSLEEYYQEAGRGGRDEKKAFAVALCSSTDSAKLKKRLADEFPDKEFIYRVYEALGNYYQIAVGYGLDTVHDFSLTDFCSAYKFSLLQAHHALKILGLSGYIEYTEEVDNASRLMFTATRDELYRYLSENKRTDEVIQTILRSYTGLFADYVYIDESVIATRARVTPHEVYETLAGLSRYRIVNYIPHKKTPLIIYTQTREEQRYLSIPRSAYEERKERFGKRIEKVLEYINEERVCRSRMLLSYFGEEDSAPCGCCDVCLSKHESQLMNWEFSAIRESLVKVLAGESPIPVKELIEKLPFPQEKSLTAIRFLADQDPRFTLSDGYLSHEDSAK